MRQNIHAVQKFYRWFPIVLIIALTSCDLSTREYYIYSNNEGTDTEIYFLWSDASQCGITIQDSTINYDVLKLYFPSDHSTITSHCEPYYDYIRDSSNLIVDSVELCADYFKIREDDARVLDNDYVILQIYKRNSIIQSDTLFREKVTQNFIDRLPLPKLH